MLNLSRFKPRFWDHRDAASGPGSSHFSFRRKWLMIVAFTTVVTLAPLLGRLVAAQATGTPWPLEQALADAVDPGRWIVRTARAAEPASAGERRAARLQPG